MENVTLRKLKHQNGYQLSDEIVTIEINDKGIFKNGELLEDNDNTAVFTYYNNPIPKIQTGNEINYILLISSIIISLLVVTITVIIMIKRRK